MDLLQLKLLCLFLPVCFAIEFTQVTVQPDTNCTSSALNEALQNMTPNTAIFLENGVHCLHTFTTARDGMNVSIVGEDSNNTVIKCKGDIGLAFLNMSNLEFKNLQIINCGMTGENLEYVINVTQESVQLSFYVPYETRVALFIANTVDLHMSNVLIANNSGLGLVGINLIGNSEIEHCIFFQNVRKQQKCDSSRTISYTTNMGEEIGGGAYFLYQDFQESNIGSCNIVKSYSLEVYNSSFLSNSECSVLTNTEFIYRDSRRAQQDGYSIGGGGGLSVILAQYCYGVDVSIASTNFQNNTASNLWKWCSYCHT